MSGLLEKPQYGAPCNNCGQCCIVAQCPISTALFGERPICPAIERGEGSALVCGVIASPDDYLDDVPGWGRSVLASAFAFMLGAGSGCDGQTLDDDPARVAEYRPIIRERAAKAIAAADPDVRMFVEYLSQHAPTSPEVRA